MDRFGLALLLTGVALMLGSLTPLRVVPVFMLMIRRSFIRPEEALLEQSFCGGLPRLLPPCAARMPRSL